MGFLEDKLYWSTTQADGSPRSFLAMLLDPVGACFQPADLSPFNAEDTVAAQVPMSERAVDVEGSDVKGDQPAAMGDDKPLPVEPTK